MTNYIIPMVLFSGKNERGTKITVYQKLNIVGTICRCKKLQCGHRTL